MNTNSRGTQLQGDKMLMGKCNPDGMRFRTGKEKSDD